VLIRHQQGSHTAGTWFNMVNCRSYSATRRAPLRPSQSAGGKAEVEKPMKVKRKVAGAQVVRSVIRPVNWGNQ